MDSAASSTSFRTASSQLAKDEVPPFTGLFIANSVTLSTRVRIEILRAISKVLVTNATDSFVQGFSSRPLLHYYTREGAQFVEGTNRTYTFVEAVAKFGALVPPVGLLSAYKRARPAFNGCLEQYFVVLKEEGPPLLPSGPNSAPLGSRGHGRGFGIPRGGRGQRFSYRGSTLRGRAASLSSGFSRGLPRRDSRKRPNDSASFTPSKRSSQQSQVLQTSAPDESIDIDNEEPTGTPSLAESSSLPPVVDPSSSQLMD